MKGYKQPTDARRHARLVRRAAFICKYCDGVYADEPVTSCDCLGYLGQKPPHFIKGKIEYRLPNANVDLPDAAAQDSASKSNSPAVSG
jgi:hypothetical protein